MEGSRINEQGVQNIGLPDKKCAQGHLPGRAPQPGLGIPFLSVHTDCGQPHFEAASEVGRRSFKSFTLPDQLWRGLQICSLNQAAGIIPVLCEFCSVAELKTEYQLWS
jgi:hypothetical protein